MRSAVTSPLDTKPDTRLWQAVATSIASASGQHFAITSLTPLAGGCINRGFRLEGGAQRYFVKLNDAARLDMFEAEFAALREIGASASVRVPTPLCTGQAEGWAWLALEYLALAPCSGTSMATLGERLADLHRHTGSSFGWQRDNTIGSTPQINRFETDWLTFWREHRLRYQLDLAAGNGYASHVRQGGERLLSAMQELFADYRPTPSLLHGDLWAGNAACDETGKPVVFDPASYYGDRETDLAMTELFGGFPARFYRAYNDAWPLDPGYAARRDLYNLYHLLNHLNLFGASHLNQVEATIDRLLARLR